MVILLLGILAIVVAPRFQSSGGLAEYTYQSRLISSLRAMQTRAMHDARSGFCFRVNIFDGVNSSFGPPSLDYADGNQSATCATSIDNSELSQAYRATVAEMSADGIAISSFGGAVSFNSLGCPVTTVGACLQRRRIEIRGENTLYVCVESQGYIHACS